MAARTDGSPTGTSGPTVLVGPVLVDGAAARLVSTPDGGATVETWAGPARGWVAGGADGASVLKALPLSPEAAAALGVPANDLPAR